MPIIEHANRIPRTLSLNDALFLRSLSYNKLPQQLLRLSIIKLDGSSFGNSRYFHAFLPFFFFKKKNVIIRVSFELIYYVCVLKLFLDVQIGSSSTVGELKLAVEEVFSWSPKVGQGKISW